MVVRSDRSGSAVLGDATGRLLNAGREGTLTSNEQDARKAPSRTYLRTLRFATRGWLNITANRRRALLRFAVDKILSTAIVADV